MTLDQLHTRFKILYDKIDSFNYPELTPEAIDEFLCIGQEKLIDFVLKEGVESNGEYADWLKNITLPYTTSTFYTRPLNKPDSTFVPLPNDYRSCLLEEVTITYTKCGNTVTERVKVVPITRDRYNIIKDDPFNKPSEEVIHRIVSANISGNETFELISSPGVTIIQYHLDYIQQPPRIEYGSQYATPIADTPCVLVSKAQERLVKIAVEEAHQALGLTQQNNN